MSERKRTEIAELGEFGLIDSLTAGFESKCKTTLRGVGDDAAVYPEQRTDKSKLEKVVKGVFNGAAFFFQAVADTFLTAAPFKM